MKGFRKREDELETRLRGARPEARSDFVRTLAGELEDAPRSRARRLALAAILTAMALAAFGAVGGLSYAGKAVSLGADESVSHSQRGGNDEDDDNGLEDDDDTPAANQYAGKITICHRTSSETNPFVLISVSVNAVPAHKRNHGDTLPGPGGTCPGPPIP